VHKTILGHVEPGGGSGSFHASEAPPVPHAGRYLALGLGGHQMLTYTAGCLVLLIFVVVVPAVWSTSETRRMAAQEVLDKLLRFMRPRH
jgi:formate hydrogenlyase subunit 4